MANDPVFWLQIVDKDGVVATLPGGGRLEADLVEDCVKEVVALGVGIGRTEAHVAEDIRKGVAQAIFNLKRQTIQLV